MKRLPRTKAWNFGQTSLVVFIDAHRFTVPRFFNFDNRRMGRRLDISGDAQRLSQFCFDWLGCGFSIIHWEGK